LAKAVRSAKCELWAAAEIPEWGKTKGKPTICETKLKKLFGRRSFHLNLYSILIVSENEK
jgi:hypothetical protein